MNTEPDIGFSLVEEAESVTSTLTTDRMSARSRRIEVITRGERRRRWSPEQKQAIVVETLLPNATLALVAKRHGIGTGLLCTWRRKLFGERSGAAGCFARVDVVGVARQPTVPAVAAAQPTGLIEITLPGGASVRVDTQVDERALRRVLRVLRG